MEQSHSTIASAVCTDYTVQKADGEKSTVAVTVRSDPQLYQRTTLDWKRTTINCPNSRYIYDFTEGGDKS